MEKEAWIVSDAAIEDLPSIVAIYNATIPGRMVTADLEEVTVASRQKWFEDHSPELRPLWVVKQHGQVAAWFSFKSFYGRPAYSATAEFGIYVATSFHGRGIGSFLLERAFEACPKLQIQTLLGFVFGHNEPSLKLLGKSGFEQWGYLPRVASLDGIDRDLIIMGKRIE